MPGTEAIGARELRLELEPDPCRTQVSIFSFFLFVCLVCSSFSYGATLQQFSVVKKATAATLLLPSSSFCGAALQHSIVKKAMATTLLSHSSSSSLRCNFFFSSALQRSEEGDGSCHHLFLLLLELRCNAFFFLFWSCAIV